MLQNVLRTVCMDVKCISTTCPVKRGQNLHSDSWQQERRASVLSQPWRSSIRALLNNLVVACGAPLAEKRYKMSLTCNCVAANAMSSQSLASFVQSAGLLAAAMHLESKITGEWPWSNRPSVENTLQSIKSPLPPVLMAIRQPHHDKWLFSGFYL